MLVKIYRLLEYVHLSLTIIFIVIVKNRDLSHQSLEMIQQEKVHWRLLRLSMRIEGRLEGLQKQQKFPTLMYVETHLDPILLVICLILTRKGTKSLFMALVKPKV